MKKHTTLEDRTLTALGRLAVANASGDREAIRETRGILWEAACKLCRDRRGEPLPMVLEFRRSIVSSSPALVLAVNYFAAVYGVPCRARETPLS